METMRNAYWPMAAILLSCFAIPSVAAAQAKPAIPIGNPAGWITSADYPAGALRAKASGVLTFMLSIDTMGKVTGCTVTATSGNQLLDDTACQKLVERARFRPATDQAGQPIAATYYNRVRWAIPKAAGTLPVTPGMRTIGFDVDTNGGVGNCTEEGDATELLHAGFCDRLSATMKPPPGSQAKAKWHVTMRTTVEVSVLP
jgi:TonB family protein